MLFKRHTQTGQADRGDEAYNAGKVQAATMHFLSGKTFQAIAGFLTTILFARELIPSAYAAYAVMMGLSGITGTFSSFGLKFTAQRFVPEMRVRGQKKLLIHLVSGILTVRVVALAVSALVLVAIAPWISRVFSVTDWVAELRMWPLSIFCILSFQFISVLLETLLLQQMVKRLWIAVAILRLALTIYLIVAGVLTLKKLVWIELISYAVGTSFALVSLVIALKEIGKEGGNADRDPTLWPRVLNFSVFNYLRVLVTLFYGRASNYLIIAKYMFPLDVATFGFAQTLSSMVERYMPSTLLSNMIRPVFMARFAKTNDYRELNSMANLVFKLNNFILAPLLVWICISGGQLTTALTSGKYPDAGWMLLVLLGILVVSSHNQILEVEANAAEKNSLLFLSSLGPVLSLLLAIFLVQRIGVLGLLLSRYAGILVRDVFLAFYLRRHHIPYSLDWPGVLRLLLAILLPILLLWPFVTEQMNWLHILILGVASLAFFLLAAFFLKPFSHREREIINRLIGRQLFVW